MRVPAWLSALAVVIALLPQTVHRPLVASDRGRLAPGHVRGAVHVHTARSEDARGSIREVARAAAAAGLAFVVVTDHNTSAEAAEEGYHDGVLVLVGTEKSTTSGHALVLGTGPLPFRLDGDPATVVRDVAELRGFVAAAHPCGTNPWAGGLSGLAAVEAVNLADREAWPRMGPMALVRYARLEIDPVGTLLRAYRPSRPCLALWDAALAERPMAGLLGSDAHGGIRAGRTFLSRPSHRDIFRLASQHLLLGAPLEGRLRPDRAAVLDALRSGRGYAAFDGLADASTFRFEVQIGGGTIGMGQAAAFETEDRKAEDRTAARLVSGVDVPGAELLLLRDGVAVARGPRIDRAVDRPGVYRVEGYLPRSIRPDLPWIVSNPVTLYPAAELRAREERAARLPPAPAPLSATRETLDRFEGPSLSPRWQIDRSPDAEARLGLENGALRLDFALGLHGHTHASVCAWEPRDLTDSAALGFRVRADRPMRLDIQVRTASPGVPGGVRIWRRSVRADPDWSEAMVPLATLTTFDGRGGRPDLAHVQGLYFHVDEANLPPGSKGTVWIDEVRLGR